MFYEIANILGLVAIGYALWKQQQRIEMLELVVGYTLSLIDEEEENVSSDYEA